jgi:hypothetical protein
MEYMWNTALGGTGGLSVAVGPNFITLPAPATVKFGVSRKLLLNELPETAQPRTFLSRRG